MKLEYRLSFLVIILFIASCSQVVVDSTPEQKVYKNEQKQHHEPKQPPAPVKVDKIEVKKTPVKTDTIKVSSPSEKVKKQTLIQRIIAYEKRQAEAERKTKQKKPRETKAYPSSGVNGNQKQKETIEVLKELNASKRTVSFSNKNIVSIDNEGRLIINGKPFFVIGLYSVPKRDIPKAKKLGFNSVHTYSGEGTKDKFRIKGRTAEILDYLKAADNEGLKVWMGLPRYETEHENIPLIAGIIDVLKDAPALMSWYLYDEPDCDRVSVYKIKNVAELLRKQDPNHPKLLSLCKNNKGSQRYYPIPDILVTFHYPLGRTSISKVSERIESVHMSTRNKKPTWNVVQLHGKGKGGRGYGLKEPSFQELRNMTYQSIVAGSKGLLFFTYSGSQFKLYKSPEGLKNIKKITNELQIVSQIILSDRPKSHTIKYKKKPQIKTRVFKYQQQSYLFVVNIMRESATIDVSIARKTNGTVSVLFEDRDIVMEDNKFTETIEPLGVRIYQFNG